MHKTAQWVLMPFENSMSIPPWKLEAHTPITWSKIIEQHRWFCKNSYLIENDWNRYSGTK